MDTQLPVSPIKREKLKKQRLLLLKQSMRSSLPVLSRSEIRRYRLPYYDSVLADLMERGLTNTEQFLRQLVQYQEELRKEQGPDSIMSRRPRLRESRDELDLVYRGLANAEVAHFKNNMCEEIDELLKLGIQFGLGAEDWWWLGEQILIQANNRSKEFMRDGGKKQALTKFIYGKFLFENMNDYEKAKLLLMESRALSNGSTWSARRELGPYQDSLFVEACILLYRILLIEAKQTMKSDPLKAARICILAQKRALDACDHIGEATALMLQGICEMEAGDADSATISFEKVLILYTRAGQSEGVCEGRIHAALAYLKIGKFSMALAHLEKLLAYAQENYFPYYTAQAHKCLGEFHLNQGSPHLATSMLIKAIQEFHDIGDILNREQVKNLAAISSGQELIPKYVELILKSGRKEMKGYESLIKLVNWKDTRELFWTEESSCLAFSRSSLHFFDHTVNDNLNCTSSEKLLEVIEMDTEEEQNEFVEFQTFIE
ncbi:uncharacterized protein LOC116168108 [Photinus pyralis]|uniref:uncharacterized protein LOC116168108 n=1 Tax=Photinus pyralis TaxID=7054 RepID=UPI0012678061|nr:uncharacterized protein LOC116168108 [Photinus pyralis]